MVPCPLCFGAYSGTPWWRVHDGAKLLNSWLGSEREDEKGGGVPLSSKPRLLKVLQPPNNSAPGNKASTCGSFGETADPISSTYVCVSIYNFSINYFPVPSQTWFKEISLIKMLPYESPLKTSRSLAASTQLRCQEAALPHWLLPRLFLSELLFLDDPHRSSLPEPKPTP